LFFDLTGVYITYPAGISLKHFEDLPFVLNLQPLSNKQQDVMKIDVNKMVSMIYELRETNSTGKVLEELPENKPLKFIFGTGKLLPAFEANILSLCNGDTFRFNLGADQAYGERREEMIIDVPLSVFEHDGKVNENICRVGNEVPMVDSSGNSFSGIINEISSDFVKMDFNHPMAGVDLYFKGRILEVREATQEELSAINNSCSGCEGHNHSECEGSCG
jgi:FKBP-type peptidyl-prolyl cis-trans isomerase SlyD